MLLSNATGESECGYLQDQAPWIALTHDNRFSIQSEADYVDHLLREDQAIYMNFFDWMFRTSREKTLQSYDEYWRRLCQYFELFARRRVNEDVRKQMRRVRAFLPCCRDEADGGIVSRWSLPGRAQDSPTNEEQEYPGCRCLLCDLSSSLGPFKVFSSWKHDCPVCYSAAMVCHYRDSPRCLASTKHLSTRQPFPWQTQTSPRV